MMILFENPESGSVLGFRKEVTKDEKIVIQVMIFKSYQDIKEEPEESFVIDLHEFHRLSEVFR